MQKKVIVLGSGQVGSAIAIDLSHQYDVTVMDISNIALSKLNRCFGINCLQGDITERRKLEQIIEPFDLVIGAMPGALSFEIIRRVIECGKNMIDISFFHEDAAELAQRAKYKQVSLIIDCGVAPGLSNMIAGYHAANMSVDRFECFVGGLPVERVWPWQYKAVFSPSDVIDEYTRPARFIENGKHITKEAFSDPELVQIKGIGTLEACNTDGLRTMLTSLKIPNMVEKTLRYLGTIEYLRVLSQSGFFSENEIEVNGTAIRPLDFTTKLLTPNWELKHSDEDLTIMQIKILGKEDGILTGFEYFMLDRYDAVSGTHSMARTSGFTCSAVANLVLEGSILQKGLITPEQLAMEQGLFVKVLHYLESRGIKLSVNRLF